MWARLKRYLIILHQIRYHYYYLHFVQSCSISFTLRLTYPRAAHTLLRNRLILKLLPILKERATAPQGHIVKTDMVSIRLDKNSMYVRPIQASLMADHIS